MAAARSPGPLRAFYKRIDSRRGKHIAAVATARKLAKIIWHMLSKNADYIWARPALLARKFRSVELRAGLPMSHARRGTAIDYNIPAKRAEERSRVEKAEAAYAAETFPMANEAGKAEGCGKSGRMRRRGYSTTSVCIGLAGAMQCHSTRF